MPYGTLADRLASGPMPIRECLELGITLAEALHVVHGVGLLHRDVKPSNIGFGDRRVPKLLDFGLVHMLTHAEAGGTSAPLKPPAKLQADTLSLDGSLVGTPLYFSPEAVRGGPPSPACDLWSLNVLLLEAIIGRHPFRGRTIEDTLTKIRVADIDGALARFAPASSDVARYFEQALSRNERVRPQRAADVASHLRALVGR